MRDEAIELRTEIFCLLRKIGTPAGKSTLAASQETRLRFCLHQWITLTRTGYLYET